MKTYFEFLKKENFVLTTISAVAIGDTHDAIQLANLVRSGTEVGIYQYVAINSHVGT